MNPETPRSIYDSDFAEILERARSSVVGFGEFLAYDGGNFFDRPDFRAALLAHANAEKGPLADIVNDALDKYAQLRADANENHRPVYDPSKLAKTLMGIP
jgi:hypothetical protein